MTFITHTYTNCGGRANNEDFAYCGNNVWLVADGLGGHDSGEVASRTAADAVKKYVTERGISLSPIYMTDVINNANLAVIAEQNKDAQLASMRTTIVFAITDGASIRYANVGDSRFYYFKKGKIFAQSEDHSVAAASVKLGESTYDKIREDPDRNKLIKVLGDKEELSLKIPEAAIIPESGDAMLLCSDGFWENVFETEMETDLCKSSGPREWVEFMVKRLLLKTKNIDNDNFTVVAMMVQ